MQSIRQSQPPATRERRRGVENAKHSTGLILASARISIPAELNEGKPQTVLSADLVCRTFRRFPLLSTRREARITRQLAAIVEREGDDFVALCPEVDIASQGDPVDEARANLREALELFFETESEIRDRFHDEVYVTQVEVAVG
jgi:predicted RNase H-like HicB family nuclease